MEGALFYWSVWMLWVYVTFILSKQHRYRLKLAVMVLLVIIFSASHVSFGRFDIKVSGLLLLLFSYLFLSQEKRWAFFYTLICSLIISIAYVTFQLFEVFDPIWMIFNREWMIGIVISYLCLILQKTLKGRLLIVFSGMMQGEILSAYIFNQFQPYQIGAFSFMDVCALIGIMLVSWSLLEKAGAILQQHFQGTGRAKQKSS